MKRTLSGIASAAIVLGAISPMAFAQTSSSGLTPAGQLPIVVNGQVLSNPYEMVGMDSGNKTGFFPIYYFDQALEKIGITATWNGATHTWALTDSNVNASNVQVAGGMGTGNTTVTLNGTPIKMFYTQVAKDPAGGPVTTYMPIYYINNILSALGIHGTFSGQTGLNITTGQTLAGSLSAITVTGATSGTGTSSSPAVALNNGKVTLSTTLTDSNGNPIGNAAVTFNFSEYGALPSNAPTVTNASGATIPATTGSTAYQYTVYTNSSGVASITVSGPVGLTYAYQVTATAPISNGSNQMISSQPAYVEFVANNQAGIAPYGTASQPYSASLGTAVPITVILPPGANGQPQANVLVTLSLSNPNGGTNYAYFTNSSGANLGTQIQVTTNSSGVAQAWVSDANAQPVVVTANVSNATNVSNTSVSTYLNFGQAGVPASIANYNDPYSALVANGQQPLAGTTVTITGTLVDAAGNPVANGQVLVTGSSSSGDFGYVTTSNGKSTTTDFPSVGTLQPGQPVSSALGDVITADANGNFSLQVTDTQNEQASLTFYSVSNGVISPVGVIKTDTLKFAVNNQLSTIALGATDAQADGNQYTNLTGLTGSDNAPVPVYVDPQNPSGTMVTNQSITYTLSVSSGDIVGIGSGAYLAPTNANNSTIPINSGNGLSSVQVTVTALGNNQYQISVPGQQGVLTTSSPDFTVLVKGSTGSTKLTVSSGSLSSTATITFTSSNPTVVASLTPVSSVLAAGQNETVTFTVEDADGNPVSGNTQVAITAHDSNDPLWITAVNGTNLSEYETINGAATSVSTPIPLGTSSYATSGGSTLYPAYTNSGYFKNGVSISGVVSWDGTVGDPIYVTTNSQGQVTLTLQNGNVTYFDGNNTTLSNGISVAGTSGSEGFYTYSSDTAATASDLTNMGVLVIGQANGDASTSLGTIYIGSGGATQTPAAFTYVDANNHSYTYSNTSDTFTVSSTQSVSGGNYAITSFTPVGGTATSTIPSGVSVNSSTGTVSVSQNAAVGTYTVSYNLNGVTESTGTFKVYSGSGVAPTEITGSSVTVPAATYSGTLKVTVSNGGSPLYVNVTAGESANAVAAAIYNALVNANISGDTFSVSGSTVSVTAASGSPTLTVVDATNF